MTTPDIRILIENFAGGLRDYVTKQLSDQAARIDQVTQLLASIVAEQDAQNWLDKKNLRSTIVAREGALSASIDDVRTVAVSTQTAFASYQVTVSASLGDLSAWIETNATAVTDVIGTVAALYSIKVNAGGKVAGLKLGADDASSYFDVEADVFRVGRTGQTGGTFVSVFQIANVDGTPKLSFRGDMIADGTVTAAKMNVGTLDAVSADVGHLTAGTMTDSTGNLMVINLDAPSITMSRP